MKVDEKRRTNTNAGRAAAGSVGFVRAAVRGASMQRSTREGPATATSAQAGSRRRRFPLRLHRSAGILIALVGTVIGAAGISTIGCTPKVAIQAPKEPIVINMNIKVEHQINVNVDRDLDALFEEEEDIF
jgi:hypothetical protein